MKAKMQRRRQEMSLPLPATIEELAAVALNTPRMTVNGWRVTQAGD